MNNRNNNSNWMRATCKIIRLDPQKCTTLSRSLSHLNQTLQSNNNNYNNNNKHNQ